MWLAGCAWERKVGMKEVQRCSETSVGGVVAGCARERKVGMKEVQRCSGTSIGGVVAGCVWEQQKVGMRGAEVQFDLGRRCGCWMCM